MGRCVYCGKDAGFLRSAHSECQSHHNAALTSISQMGTQAVLAGGDLAEVDATVKKTAASGHVSNDEMKKCLVDVWTRAVDRAFEDGILSDEEEHALMAFANQFSLSSNDLDAKGAYTRVGRGCLLREVMEGKPPRPVTVVGSCCRPD